MLAHLGKDDLSAALLFAFNNYKIGMDEYTQATAAQELGYLGDLKTIEAPFLSALIREQYWDNKTRLQIQNILKTLGWQPRTTEDKVRFYIGTAHLNKADSKQIIDEGSKAVPYLSALLKDGSIFWLIRVNAVNALGEIDDPRVIELLSYALADGNKQVRSEATDTLKKIGEKTGKDWFKLECIKVYAKDCKKMFEEGQLRKDITVDKCAEMLCR